jgi:uncharacterized membrane protein (UPF0127 family)
MRKLVLVLCLAVGAAACSGGASTSAANAASRSTLIPLTVTSAGKQHAFKVEVARTPEQQERGLMFRDHLAPDHGMIFPMAPPRVASFWMKNTVIPLDMIFVRSDGTIAKIAAETVPYSLDPVSSDEPVAAVLEIAGGRAAELGLQPDDKIMWTAG